MRGRPKGSKDRVPRNVWELLRQRGDRDPLDILSEACNSTMLDPALKIQSAVALSAYVHGKRPAMRFVQGITGLPAPKTTAEACAYIARLAELAATGVIDLDAAAAIKDLLTAFIDARTGTDIEERMQAAEQMIREILARGLGSAVAVQGGLPVMPGHEQMILPRTGSVIDQSPDKSNPWAPPTTHELGEAVKIIPKRRGRPPKGFKYGPKPDSPRT
jgi:hypothetical protein